MRTKFSNQARTLPCLIVWLCQIGNFGKNPLKFIQLLQENNLKTTPPPILRNTDNFPIGAFYSTPLQLGT